MERIASFCIDHDKLCPGIYVSRVDHEDIVTYDLRFKKPNNGDFLSPAAAHTIEHIFATHIRSSKLSDKVVYFGPMGCLTGFYLILKGASHAEAIGQIKETIRFAAEYEGEIPGAKKIECGNYLMQDLPAAKAEAERYLSEIAEWQEKDLVYP